MYRPTFLVDYAEVARANHQASAVQPPFTMTRPSTENMSAATAATLTPGEVASYSVSDIASLPGEVFDALSPAAKVAILPAAREYLASSGTQQAAEQWREATDPATGKTYYFDAVSGRTQWLAPTQVAQQPAYNVHVSRRGSVEITSAATPTSASSEFFYRSNVEHTVEGPFTLDQMRSWYRWGHFEDALQVRRGRQGTPFVALPHYPAITSVGRR